MERRISVEAGQETEVSTTEARQAVVHHRLRYMLGAGIGFVVLGFLAVYLLS